MTPDPLTPSPDSPTPSDYDPETFIRELADRWAKIEIPSGKPYVPFMRDRYAACLREYREVVLRECDGDGRIEEIVVQANKIKELERELAALVKERDDYKTWYTNTHDHYDNLRATLAERDREIEKLAGKLITIQSDHDRAMDGIQAKTDELDSLRAQLAETQHARDVASNAASRFKQAYEETQEKLKEAEKANDRLDNWRSKDADEWLRITKEKDSQLLALQAHVGECNQALGMIVDCWETEHLLTDLCVSKAHELLSSQPELPLIEEVMAAAALIAEIADKQDRPAPVIMAGRLSMIADKAKHILTRLNPRTD